jgi:hypothetical protein
LKETPPLISGFRRDVDKVCALLGHYAGSSGNPLPTFRGQHIGLIFKRQEVQEEKEFLILKMGPILSPGTSVKYYHSMLRNIPEEKQISLNSHLFTRSSFILFRT